MDIISTSPISNRATNCQSLHIDPAPQYLQSATFDTNLTSANSTKPSGPNLNTVALVIIPLGVFLIGVALGYQLWMFSGAAVRRWYFELRNSRFQTLREVATPNIPLQDLGIEPHMQEPVDSGHAQRRPPQVGTAVVYDTHRLGGDDSTDTLPRVADDQPPPSYKSRESCQNHEVDIDERPHAGREATSSTGQGKQSGM